MSTLLARQVAAQTARPRGATPGRASLLRTPREAASTDVATIFAEALVGLDRLCEMDSRFYKFRSSLFSEKMCDYERDAHSDEANEPIKKAITDFFTLLPPYILLQPAHAAMEFLVRCLR
jgi:U3 small nucleolar RNA-associated protein 10